MTEEKNIEQPEDIIEFPLTLDNQWIIQKLVTWSKIVAIINIVFGIIYCLTIFSLFIPTVVMGIFLILMGTRLNSAAAHLKYGLYQKDSASFGHAFKQLRDYMLFNGIFMLMIVIITVIIIMVALTAGAAFEEFFDTIYGSV